MFKDFKKFWKKHGFWVIFAVFILIILLNLFFAEDDGTYSTEVSYVKGVRSKNQTTYVEKRQPITESKLEVFTRKKLEEIFKKPFPKIRPQFLNNPVTGGKHNLEIDCYNDELKLGVEIQGIQHYKFSPYFHKSYEAFLNQKYRDELKRRMCKDEGIILIEVPYNVKEKDVENFIISEISKTNFPKDILN